MPPAHLQLSRLSQNSVQLCWSYVPNGSGLSYIVYRKTGGGEYANVGETYNNFFTETNLSPDTKYQWQILLKAGRVYGPPSSIVTISGNQQNWAPSELQVEAIALNKISLRWQDNCFNESGFKVERKSPESDYLEIATLKPNTIAYIDSSFAPNAQYLYRLRAIAKSIYSDYSNVQACAVDSLSWAAKSFKYEFKRDFYKHKLALQFSWQNQSLVAKYFILERKVDAGVFCPIAKICANGLEVDDNTELVPGKPWTGLLSTQYYSQWDGFSDYALDNFSYTDDNLKPNTYYSYRIRAMADSSYSSYSEELVMHLTPTDWSPDNILLFTKSPSSVFLSWNWRYTDAA
ncbi:MAG: hypothetical protein CVU50_07790 [Candidatus Cloacimonetes bacterium HGW-Cloacimonetes-3]|nr:MAG: hypothetical protein CVU50_07790 [Candidatus Cloacimonetes bacterium HGW-Cloacimonetes-3]